MRSVYCYECMKKEGKGMYTVLVEVRNYYFSYQCTGNVVQVNSNTESRSLLEVDIPSFKCSFCPEEWGREIDKGSDPS